MNMERQDLVDALEAFVLDQLDDATTEAYERALDDHPDLAIAAAELREALAGLAYDDGGHAPTRLRNDVLTAATRRRAPGIDEALTVGAGPSRCHRATVEIVSAVIGVLDDVDMRTPTIYGIPVIELIRHLNGVERQLAETFSAPNGSPVGGLTAGGHRAVRDGTDSDAGQTVIDAWHRHSETLAAMVARTTLLDDGTNFDVSGVTMPADQLLVVRSFEQWSHAEDICRAVGRPLLVPPPDVVHTMAAHAVDLLLPVVGMLTRRSRTTVRITLTGSGGGSWVGQVGASDAPDTSELDPFTRAGATLVVDVVDFCRLVADRADADMPVHRYGNVEVCNEILDIAPSLADYGAGPLP